MNSRSENLTLSELARKEYFGPPLRDVIVFRCSKPMAIRLRAHALAEQVDLSAAVRCLIRAGAEKYGLDLNLI